MPKTSSLVLCALAVLAAADFSSAKIFSKCTLARRLYRYGIPVAQLPDWVCIAEHESSFDTKAIGRLNSDDSVDWGLFQINDRYWCKPSDGRASANICKLPCKVLLSDSIGYAVKCAKQIMQEQGLTAWVAWNNYCQGPKPSVRECFSRRLA